MPGVAITRATRDVVVKAAVSQQLLAAPKTIDEKPFAFFYDLDAWEANLQTMRDAFPAHWLHALAVKTNPVLGIQKVACGLGHGAECASVGELVHSLNAGFRPGDIIFDSPCKTLPEIKFGLEQGIHLNIDNIEELARVEELLASNECLAQKVRDSNQVIGVRINPLVGAGTIAALSVSTGKSKFGIPLYDDETYRAELMARVVSCPWINCVHVHTGSGGMGLEQMQKGVRAAVNFAQDINDLSAAFGFVRDTAANPETSGQIRVIDVGGGLATNYTDDSISPTFIEYAAALKEHIPELFTTSSSDTDVADVSVATISEEEEEDESQVARNRTWVFDRVVTEFGAASHIKFAWLASRVEYVKECDNDHRIALIHAGSDLFLRACYCPDAFGKHRIAVYDEFGVARVADTLSSHDIAGPLCFSGDVVVRNAMLPPVETNDIVLILDCGGNCMGLKSMHCSRQMPTVFGYRVVKDGSVVFAVLKKAQTIQDSLKIWE